MFEVTSNPHARKAIENAHQARADAFKQAFAWLFPSKSSR